MQDVKAIHEELVAIASERNRLQVRQARLLVRAEELEIWRPFHCAHIYEYLEQCCDLQPRTAREYVRVARALVALPLTRDALESERIRYSIARELTRIVTPDTEAEWLARTSGMTAREVEDEIAGRERGDRPHDPRDPDHLVALTLQVRESTFAAFVQTRMQYVDEAGERLSDDDVILALCRGGGGVAEPQAIIVDAPHPADLAHGDVDTDDELDRVGREPPYLLAISTCRACKRSFQITAGRELEVSAAALALAQCDARHLGDLESETPQRALTSVTPRLRQQVLLRDLFTCSVPGCRSKRCLDVHHIQPQAEGGPHTSWNLTTLCWGHHRQLHEGRLAVVGRAPLALAFTWPTDPGRTSTRHALANRDERSTL